VPSIGVAAGDDRQAPQDSEQQKIVTPMTAVDLSMMMLSAATPTLKLRFVSK